MSRQSVRILLVDDVRVFLELERTFLQRSANEIHTAASGEEALEKTLKIRPHLVLLDCNMPGMDGFECCRRIKSNPILGHVKVIMVTTQGRERDRARCLEAGCDDFLTKPINRREFIACVERMLAVEVRVAERLPLEAKLIYRAGDEPEQSSVTANVSVGGAFVLSATPPPPGTQLRLQMELPGEGRPIDAEGEVVWTIAEGRAVTGAGFGLKFTRIDLETARLIERYIAARAK